MIKVAIPHKIYSENKLKIKNIIKKYGMSWESGKNGWINMATGDGVYIDKSIMDMILSDSFSGDMPMTMFVDSQNKDFLDELETKIKSLGGEITENATPEEAKGQHIAAPAISRHKAKTVTSSAPDVFERLKLRDAEGCTAPELQAKAMEDLKDISRRWDRRKGQILQDYEKIGLAKETIDRFLHREEIAFRKSNACWVTGEFPADASGGDDH